MELGSYTERQRQRDPLNPQQQQNRYAAAFSHPPAEYSNNQFQFYQERGTALRSAFAGGAAGGADAAEGWPLHASDAAADPTATADSNSTSSTRDALNTSYSPYDVAYRGQAYADNAFDQETLHPPQKKFPRLRVFLVVLAVVALSGCYFFQRRRALQSATRTAIDACDLDKEPACREYAFFDGFNEESVRLVDHDPKTGNFLFRSSVPLAEGTGRLMLGELTAAMRAAAEAQTLQLPQHFRTTLVSLEWGEPNGRLLEQCELAREACEARSAPQTATVHWPVYGQAVSPYGLPSHERDVLAANFTAWDGDNLDQKIQVLYHVTHSFLQVPAAAGQVNSSPAAVGGGEAAETAAEAGDGEASHNTRKGTGSRVRRISAKVEEDEGDAEEVDEEEDGGTAEEQSGHRVRVPPQQLAGNNQAYTTSPAVPSAASSSALQQISRVPVGSGAGPDGLASPPAVVGAANPAAAVAVPLPSGPARPAADAPAASAAVVEAPAAAPLVSVVHCHHGKDRTGLLVGAYKMKYMQYSLQQVVQENFALGQNLVEAVNALMWYCLYLEKAAAGAAAAAGGAPAGARVKCFDAVAAYPDIDFISHGKAPHTPPGVLPPESAVPRPLQPVDVASAPSGAAPRATETAGAATEAPGAGGEGGGGATAGETRALPAAGGVQEEAGVRRGGPSPAVRLPAATAAPSGAASGAAQPQGVTAPATEAALSGGLATAIVPAPGAFVHAAFAALPHGYEGQMRTENPHLSSTQGAALDGSAATGVSAPGSLTARAGRYPAVAGVVEAYPRGAGAYPAMVGAAEPEPPAAAGGKPSDIPHTR